MITTNVFHRTYMIKSESEGVGTAFTVDVENNQYIITAKHLVKNIRQKDNLQFRFANGWENLNVNTVGHSIDELDISVLATNRQISPQHYLQPRIGPIHISADVYFAGFPFGWEYYFGGINRDCPLPFIKKGIIGMLDGQQIFLDAHNNKGFSGSPIIYFENNDYTKPYVIGVISGYYNDEKGFNSGIASGTSIKVVLDLIKQNPIGFKI